MHQTAPTKHHLNVINGGKSRPTDRADLDVRKSRMQIETAFLTAESRQRWIDYEVHLIWQKSAATIEAALDTNDTVFQKKVAFIKHIRDGYLASTKTENNEHLDKFMVMAAVLAHLAYDIIDEKSAEMRPLNYRQAHTSSDLFSLNHGGTEIRIKGVTELANVIRHKDFNFDTSTFEKEIANAVVTTLKRQLSYYKHQLTENGLSLYLLSVFTGFNQRKLLAASIK